MEINVKINVVGDEKVIEIAVLDTGIGIPYDEQDKLFKLFGFVKGTAAKNTKGVGLGLVISEQIVNQFDGQISFISIPGKGSKFTFTFKLEPLETNLNGTQKQMNDKLQFNSPNLIFKWIPKKLGN